MTEAIVTARDLAKSFGDKAVLADVSATAHRGDIIGVLGKNGAGKTTLLEILLGLSPPSAGATQLFGQNSMELTERTKAKIGFVPQQDELIDALTGRQQLDVTAAFYRQWDRELTQRLATAWEIPLTRRIQSLSVGERQKLSLLLALGHRPELLVLDEPVASLDPIARRRFIREIVDVGEQPDRTVLFSSHIVTDLERVANKVWILKEGRLAWDGDLDTLKESVVRLHIRGRRTLPADVGIPHVLSSRVDGSRATVAAAHWNGEQSAALAERLDADVEVESLGLEEIFVEMHK